jgi:CRISPR-associated protein Csd1
MMLRALCDLAEEEGLANDLDFMMKPVRYQLVVSADGVGQIVDLATYEPSDGERRPRFVVAPRRIPRQGGRTSHDDAEFLVDKCDYVFGCNPAASENLAAKLPGRATLFKRRVDALVEGLGNGTPAKDAASAVQRFLGDPNARTDAFLRKWDSGDEAEREALTRGLFEFVYEPLAPTPLHEIAEIKAYWKAVRSEASAKGTPSRCLVTGRFSVPCDKHPVIIGVPKTLSSRSSLVNFNADAFESYGLSRNENAPVSRDAAESYVNALNWLLGRGPARQNIRISSDSVVVFWAKGSGTGWVRDLLDSDSPESVRRMLQTPQSGRRAALDDPSAFYSVVLSGAQGRCVVRSFIESTVADAAAATIAYLDDTAIERPYGKGVGNFRLSDLVDSVGVHSRRETVVAADLTTRLYLAAVRRLPLPNTVLAAAVRRNKAEAAGDGKKEPHKWQRFAARTALIRAALKRNEGVEVDVTLDRQDTDPAYLLGRLFAALDRIQQDALGQVNAATAERFYGAASSTPASVFPTLLRRSQHHLAKLSRDKAGLAVVREKQIAEIIGGLNGFKRTMTLPEQGLFALGFYHQRQDFFAKKEDKQ